MAHIRVRPVSHCDFDTIRQWHEEVCACEITGDTRDSVDTQEFARRMDSILVDTSTRPRHRLMVADVDDHLAGFVLYGPNHEFFTLKERMFIYALYVHPTWRRSGVATSLMNVARDEAFEMGLDAVWLTVSEHNSARDFYTRLGYDTIRRTMILRR